MKLLIIKYTDGTHCTAYTGTAKQCNTKANNLKQRNVAEVIIRGK